MTSVATLHREVFGSPPVGVWSAPGRVNLIGEHTDYNDGLVLPIALPHRTSAACAPRGDRLLRVHSAQAEATVEVDLDTVGPGTPAGWAAYVAGVLWALAEEGHAVRGLDVTIDSEVPVGAGLSSSAALECSVGAAASDLFDLGLLFDDASRARLAAACVRAENEVAGALTGGMDQSAALLCRADTPCSSTAAAARPGTCRSSSAATLAAEAGMPAAAIRHGERRRHRRPGSRAPRHRHPGRARAQRRAVRRAPVRVRSRLPSELGLPSLRDVDPRRPRRLPRRACPATSSAAAPATSSPRSPASVRPSPPCSRGDLTEVGRLFDASHASLRDDYEVSCAELDVSVEAARAAGALGARMTGGGFGGSSIALVPADAVDAAESAVLGAFAERGWDAPRCFVVTAGAAAHRDA